MLDRVEAGWAHGMRGAVGVSLMLGTLAAQAANSEYTCSDGRELVGRFTPREARLSLSKAVAPGQQEVQKWVLQRLRETGQARYRSGEVVLVVARNHAELTLAKGAEPLVCKLKVAEFGARPTGY